MSNPQAVLPGRDAYRWAPARRLRSKQSLAAKMRNKTTATLLLALVACAAFVAGECRAGASARMRDACCSCCSCCCHLHVS